MPGNNSQYTTPLASAMPGAVSAAELRPHFSHELYSRYSRFLDTFPHWLTTFDKNGSIEGKVNVAQQLYYVPAFISVVESLTTPNGVKGSLGLLWMLIQDLWNLSTCVYAFVILPRLYREAYSENNQSTSKKILFLTTAIFFPFFLLPIAIACVFTATEAAIKKGFGSTFLNSDETLGNTPILFLGTLFYGVGMGILTLESILRLSNAENKYVTPTLLNGNIQSESDSDDSTVEACQKKNQEIALAAVNLGRDLTCTIGAFIAALSMYVDPYRLLLSAASFYGVSTVINLAQALQELKKSLPICRCPAFFASTQSTDDSPSHGYQHLAGTPEIA